MNFIVVYNLKHLCLKLLHNLIADLPAVFPVIHDAAGSLIFSDKPEAVREQPEWAWGYITC